MLVPVEAAEGVEAVLTAASTTGESGRRSTALHPHKASAANKAGSNLHAGYSIFLTSRTSAACQMNFLGRTPCL